MKIEESQAIPDKFMVLINIFFILVYFS